MSIRIRNQFTITDVNISINSQGQKSMNYSVLVSIDSYQDAIFESGKSGFCYFDSLFVFYRPYSKYGFFDQSANGHQEKVNTHTNKSYHVYVSHALTHFYSHFPKETPKRLVEIVLFLRCNNVTQSHLKDVVNPFTTERGAFDITHGIVFLGPFGCLPVCDKCPFFPAPGTSGTVAFFVENFFANVKMRPNNHERCLGSVMFQFGQPAGREVFERTRLDQRKAEDEQVSVAISQGANSVVGFLTRRVNEIYFKSFVFTCHRHGKGIKHRWHIIGHISSGRITEQHTSFSNSSISDNDTLDTLASFRSHHDDRNLEESGDCTLTITKKTNVLSPGLGASISLETIKIRGEN